MPSPQYSSVQSYDVHRGYYSAQFNPLSNQYGEIQTGQAASPYPTNVHLSVFPPQSERVQSGHYSVGQVEPSSVNYAQHHTGEPSTPVIFTSEKSSYDQFNPSFHQTVPPTSPTVAQTQYEHPSFQQVATPHYGTGNVAQMEPTDSSYYYQYSRDHNGQDALRDHLTVYDPLPNIQGISTDYQAQVGYPAQYGGSRQLERKPEYTKLFIDVEDVRDYADGQKYFAAAPAPFRG